MKIPFVVYRGAVIAPALAVVLACQQAQEADEEADVSVPPPGSGPAAVSQTVPSAATRADDFRLPYQLQVLELDSAGAYITSGVLKGEIQGRATVRFWFGNEPSGQPGTLPVQTHWAVRAEPESDSFEADLRGTFEPVSGQTHLVGTITSGPLQGQRVETESRLLNFGPGGTTSNVDGVMTIARPNSVRR